MKIAHPSFFNLEITMGHASTKAIEQAIADLRDTVARLEQTLPSVPPDAREELIRTLVSYDERVDALEQSVTRR